MARFDDREEAKAPTRDHNRCAAYGCPLLGSLSRSTNGTDTWYCRYHFDVDSRDWGGITHRVKGCMQALRDYETRKRTNPFSTENEKLLKRTAEWIRSGIQPREAEAPSQLKKILQEATQRTAAP